jgi:hypothetical protein
MSRCVALPLYLNTPHAPVSSSLGEVGLNEMLPSASSRTAECQPLAWAQRVNNDGLR